MSKFTVWTYVGGALVVKANRPSVAAQKFADGKELPPDTRLTVENIAERRWHYVVGHDGKVRRIKSMEADA